LEFGAAKMKSWFRVRAALQSALLAATALHLICVTPARAAAQKTYVDIGEIGSSAKVTLHVGDVLRVVLNANVSTGYSWQVTGNDVAVLEAGPVTNLPGSSNKIGAPGKQRLEFTAKSTGRDQLLLTYDRPWEKSAAPARELTLDVTVTGTPGDPALAVKPAGVLFGRFTGTSRCADCTGINLVLMLYTPGPNNFVDAYYVQTMTYLGGREGDTSNVSAGKWFIEKGTAAEPNGTVYALSLDSSDRTQNYQSRGQTLIPLDSDLKPVQSPYDASLHRVP
jgi:predicted secreted protein